MWVLQDDHRRDGRYCYTTMNDHLDVYAIEAHGHYGGGVVIVAATTADEAIQTAFKQVKTECSAEYNRPSKVLKLQADSQGAPRVLHFYEMYE